MAEPSRQSNADALSRVRNVARAVADDFSRFERDMRRLRTAVADAGGVTNDVVRAINVGLDTPTRRRAFQAIRSRLEAQDG